jgi:SulP family sulfate permease
MRHRRRESLSGPTATAAVHPVPIAVALRRSLAADYGAAALRSDVLAGAVVGIVALPLSMALAIAVGVAPHHGLYTAIVAGLIAALAGGSKFQVTGPTAAFVVVLAPIVHEHGLSGLLTAGLLAGLLLVAMGVARLGRFVHFIPYPVTTGFTAGIATVLATLQLKDALGLRIGEMPERFVEKVMAIWSARGTVSLAECAVAAVTLTLLVGLPRVLRRVPAPLAALGGVAAATWLIGLPVETLGTRFRTVVDGRVIAGIPPFAPVLAVPWSSDAALSFVLIRDLLPAAFAIAMLGAIESLLSAVVADGMTGKRHDPDSELVGQGLANVAAALFGGIAATGALARTATNVRSGARSPVAAMVHSVVVLGAVLLFAPVVAYVPMASLAALLLVVAWNMSELRHVRRVLEAGPRSDVFVLLTCYGLTVLFDMVVAVSVGVVLASLLFMRRMAEVTHSRFVDEDETETDYAVPPGVVVYEITGALFFGAAQHAMSALLAIRADARVVVLGLGRVPVIDATGLVALESALDQLQRLQRFVIIAGPLPHPRRVFERSELEVRLDHVLFANDVDQALRIAQDLVALNMDWAVAPKRADPAAGA